MKRFVFVGALGVAFACGSAGNDFVDEMRDGAGDVMDDVGDVMDDVGDVMDDVGDVVDDMGELPVVSAQDLVAYPVACDRERTITREYFRADGSLSRTHVTTTRFALVEVPDVKTVGIESCEHVPSDPWGITECPPSNSATVDHSCTGLVSGEVCYFSWGAGSYVGNKVQVQCESQTTTTFEDGSPARIGAPYGWSKVTLYY